MRKKLLLPTLLFILGLFIGGCSITTVKAEQDNPLKIWFQNENGSMNTYNIVDENTGVNYVVVSEEALYHGEPSVAICPRYNADGTLYVSE